MEKRTQGPQCWAMNLNKQLCHSNPSQPEKDSGLKIRLMVACKWAEAPAAEAMMWAERRGNKRQYQTFTLKISSSEAVHTVSFMALSNSSSTVRSPDIALLISGPISCSVRRPAWSEHTQTDADSYANKNTLLSCSRWKCACGLLYPPAVKEQSLGEFWPPAPVPCAS